MVEKIGFKKIIFSFIGINVCLALGLLLEFLKWSPVILLGEKYPIIFDSLSIKYVGHVIFPHFIIVTIIGVAITAFLQELTADKGDALGVIQGVGLLSPYILPNSSIGKILLDLFLVSIIYGFLGYLVTNICNAIKYRKELDGID